MSLRCVRLPTTNSNNSLSNSVAKAADVVAVAVAMTVADVAKMAAVDIITTMTAVAVAAEPIG